MKSGKNTSVIILAAGLGKRMKSPKAKVLHELGGIPVILCVVETAHGVVGENIVVVVGNQAEQVRQIVSSRFNVRFALQEKQLGTGHAVLCAMPFISDDAGNVLILCGDVPLIKQQTIDSFIKYHELNNNDVSILAVEIDNPAGYGRLITDESGMVCGIIEEADATEQQKKIKRINSGILCINKDFIIESLPKAGLNNAQGEIYLTEIIEIGFKAGKKIGSMTSADYEEFIGVNTPEDLLKAENILKKNQVR